MKILLDDTVEGQGDFGSSVESILVAELHKFYLVRDDAGSQTGASQAKHAT